MSELKLVVSIKPLPQPVTLEKKVVTHRAVAILKQKKHISETFYASGESSNDALTEVFYMVNHKIIQ